MSEVYFQPIAKTAMLIRKPVTEVFEALVNPEITAKFWFTHGSARLEAGKHVTWSWQMYNISIDALVKEIQLNKKVVVEWGNYQQITTVTWMLEPLTDNTTYVSIENTGFHGSVEELFSQVSDSTKGFTFFLSGMKAYLEHGLQLNLTEDAFPKGK